jgi:hypothetical protein
MDGVGLGDLGDDGRQVRQEVREEGGKEERW